jgi:hypothetical protein
MSCLCKDGKYRSECCPENQKNVYKSPTNPKKIDKFKDAQAISDFLGSNINIRETDSLNRQKHAYPNSIHPSKKWIGKPDQKWLINGKPTRKRHKSGGSVDKINKTWTRRNNNY